MSAVLSLQTSFKRKENMDKLKDKVVIITGGTSGIGSVTAECFASEGAISCILGRNHKKAEKIVEKIRQMGNQAYFFICDITSEEEIQKTVKEIYEQFGKIDVLYNSAGISPAGDVVTTSFQDFKNVMETDLYSIFLTSHIVIPYMEKENGGSIINIAGTYGVRPVPNKVGYACAKAGALSITKSVAIDFARKNIRCNAISPGFVETPLNDGFDGERRDNFLEKYQPANFIIQSEDIANAAVFLASEESRGITGQNIVVDGGSEACLYYLHKKD